ncbi:restriction endonuclease subunit S [Limosilactobacillus balticus]|uniref:restriction endonuclease subunit S n=1 Tax=Limosilactobacillus balticus TaxID=2759747 RepID=UPI001E312F10|nr:restriction endonuclease subunit S [Limosilactobacillus balticus]MCD7136517.1 restriction endonuclease subunit S [Limosilactobacillus balticus]
MTEAYIKLGEIATYINGYAFKPKDRGREGLPIIRIQDLTGSSNDKGFYKGKYPSKIEINNGDILISWSASLGVYIWNSGRALLNQHIFKVRFDKKEINRDYFVYAVQFSLNKMKQLTHGATMKHVVKKDFENMLIPYPSLIEQRKIAYILDKLKESMSKRSQELKKLDELIKARFVEMFGDPVNNQKGWKISKIEDVVENNKYAIKAGPFGSALKKEFYVSQGYKVYGQEQVIRNDPSFGSYYISKDKYEELKNCKVKAGDILISLVGTYGKLLIIPQNYEPGIINPRLMKVSFNRALINSLYFKYFFQSDAEKKILINNTHGGTMGILNVKIIRNIKIPLPPISLQNEFANFVRQVDKSKFENIVYLNKTLLNKILSQIGDVIRD